MDSSAAQQAPESEHQQPDKWQRISPASVIYFALKFVVAIAQNAISAIAPVAAVVATAGEQRWFILGLVALASGIVLLAGAVLSYLKFKFRIERDAILIRSGVFTRKRLTLSFDRIQNVAFREPIYFRPLNLVILTIESAGSSDEEVGLAGIPRALAEDIRRHVLAYKKISKKAAQTREEVTPEVQETTETKDLLRQPVSELVRYGLSNNNVWVFAGIAAGALSQMDELWETGFMQGLFSLVGETVGTGIVAIATFVIFMALLALLLLMGASVLGSIIVNYNYHLTYHDERYHRTRGLFERQETSIPEVKVQSLKIEQPIIARLLDRFHLTFKQVGFENHQNTNRKQKFIVPSVQASFYKKLAAKLFDGTKVLEQPLKAISDRFIFRHAIYTFGIPPVLISIPWFLNGFLFGFIPLLFPLLALPFIILRKRRYGYATDGEHAVVRSGFLGQTLSVFPLFKVQTITITQSPGQRDAGLANLTVKLAGHSLSIPYMPIDDARAWRTAALRQMEAADKPWM